MVGIFDRLKAVPAAGLPGAFLPKKAIRGINDTLYGTDPKINKLSNFDPYQQAIHQQQGEALQGGGGYGNLIQQLQSMLDPESDYYKDFENAQMRQFNEEIIPGLGERFAGVGANSGALSSSGFGQALGGAGAQLQSNIGLMKQQGVQNALQKLLGQYEGYQGQTTFDRYEKPGQQGMFQQFLPMLIKAAMGGM